MLTTKDAAAALGITPRRVIALITAGRLPATKIGRDWIIEEAALESVRERKQGRPHVNKLTTLVEEAMARRMADGITGWGLNNPDPELFDRIEVGPAFGCDSDTCNHVSHDPSAPDRKIIPRRGALVSLGDEGSDDRYSYYAVIDGDDVTFIEVSESRTYYASARLVDNVPDWALLNLAATA